MPGGPQSCPLGDFPSSLGATSLPLLSLLDPLVLSVSVSCFNPQGLVIAVEVVATGTETIGSDGHMGNGW